MKWVIIAILAVSLLWLWSCKKEASGASIDYSGSVIIDVRTADEFADGHLNKAINIPYDSIEGNVKKYVKDLDQKIMVYCRSGRRSGIAKKSLDKMGFKNVVNGGSFTKLQKQEK